MMSGEETEASASKHPHVNKKGKLDARCCANLDALNRQYLFFHPFGVRWTTDYIFSLPQARPDSRAILLDSR